MYSLNDLEMLAHGKLLVDIREIVQIFQAHITENCEVCRGNAFFCELCSSNEVGGVTIAFHFIYGKI